MTVKDVHVCLSIDVPIAPLMPPQALVIMDEGGQQDRENKARPEGDRTPGVQPAVTLWPIQWCRWT